jgi:hypothetical protein
MQTFVNKQSLNLDEIRKRLVHGDIAAIARTTRFHRFTVQLHLEGRLQKVNKEIIDAALDYLAKRDKATAKMSQKIKKAI